MAFMTKEDSYAERRLLFKNIWDTAMQIEDKEGDKVKPKVIKTLRLDDVEKYSIGRGKKQRIKNLRTVCKKILDFCDEQDADEDHKLYERKIQNKLENLNKPIETKRKKIKTHRRRKKVKRAESLNMLKASIGAKPTAELNKLSIIKKSLLENYDSSRYSLPTRKRNTLVNRAVITKSIEHKSPPTYNKANVNSSVTRRKVVKKTVKKPKAYTNKIARSSNIIGTPKFVQHNINPGLYGRAVLRNVKELLKICRHSIIVKMKTNIDEEDSELSFS